MDTGRGVAGDDAAASGPPGSQRPAWLAYDLLAAAVREHPRDVAPAARRLHGPVRDEDDLRQVLGACATILGAAVDEVCAAGIVVGPVGNGSRWLASSSTAAARLGEVQDRVDDGPGLRALRTARSVSLARPDVARVWPELARTMRELGVVATWSRPVGVDGSGPARAVVDLHLSRLPVADRARLEALAGLVGAVVERAVGELETQRAARQEVGSMTQAMASRAVIEQAKGILMADHGLDADEAFQTLVRMARPANRKVRDVAEALVRSAARRSAPADPGAPVEAEPGPTRRETVFDHSLIGTAITDLVGTIEACNPALAELFGVRTADLVGRSLFSLTHPEDLAAAHEACEQLQRAEERRSQCAVRFVRPDGVVVPARVLAAKVTDEDGAASHLVMQIHRQSHDGGARRRWA